MLFSCPGCGSLAADVVNIKQTEKTTLKPFRRSWGEEDGGESELVSWTDTLGRLLLNTGFKSTLYTLPANAEVAEASSGGDGNNAEEEDNEGEEDEEGEEKDE